MSQFDMTRPRKTQPLFTARRTNPDGLIRSNKLVTERELTRKNAEATLQDNKEEDDSMNLTKENTKKQRI
jgi:hypothetical protein